jgi:hypothetical protein
MPTAASAKPSIIEAMVLKGEPLLMPDEGAEREQVDGEELGWPNLSAKLATSGDRNVISRTGHERAHERGRECRRERRARAPFCASG